MNERAAIMFLAWCFIGHLWGPDVMLVSTFPLVWILIRWEENNG